MICTFFSRLLNNAIDDYSEEDDSSLLGQKPRDISFIHTRCSNVPPPYFERPQLTSFHLQE